MNANSGYVGYSKSVRAVEAESSDKFPLTKAAREVASYCKITIKKARELCELVGPCEYHHTSRFFNATNYYDVADITAQFDLAVIAKQLPVDFSERISEAISKGADMAERHSLREQVEAKLASETGVSVSDINEAYYHCKIIGKI